MMSFLLLAGILPAAPAVSDVTLAQDASRTVTVDYRLTGSPAIVTVDFQTNGVSVGGAALRGLAGDCNRLVSPDADGLKRIVWHPDRSWPGHRVPMTAVVRAWTEENPPDYLMLNLHSGDRRYYGSVEELPEGGATNDAYRTDFMLMRRIRATGVPWTMGSDPNANQEPGRNAENEDAHEVTLDHDYWIGVFEVTRGQWKVVTGAHHVTHYGDYDGRPVECVAYQNLRECGANSNITGNAGCYYPQAPHALSFLGLMRTLTGLKCDLPWESEWEYAARAGWGNGFWGNGKAYTEYYWGGYLSGFGRFRGNGGDEGAYPKDSPDPTTPGTAVVGSYGPNDWGLYDTAGNVAEFCIDNYIDDITASNGVPVVFATRAPHVVKGGSINGWAYACRPALRSSPSAWNSSWRGWGFRMVIRD